MLGSEVVVFVVHLCVFGGVVFVMGYFFGFFVRGFSQYLVSFGCVA